MMFYFVNYLFTNSLCSLSQSSLLERDGMSFTQNWYSIISVKKSTESLFACLKVTYDLTLQSPVVTICTTSLTFSNSTFCPHNVLLYFVWLWEQTAVISLYSMTTNDARCTCDFKCRTALAKAARNKKAVFTSKVELNLRKNLVRC